jgi:isoleucyl-tRNA synthetase
MQENDKETKDKEDFYKETVFLPKTDFPMRGGLAQKEPEILQKWQSMDLYACLREKSKDREKFILHDGPPYANGHIHMGHAFQKTLKDVANRYWQAMGYNAPYVVGWDCHGLPIEWKVEEQYRKEGKDKNNIDTLQIRSDCRNFAQKWVDIQSEEFQRLGVVGDWKNPYLTMTNKAESQIVREIHKFLKNGTLYEGVKPVMWSTVEQTALAEAEVEYKEHKSVTIWIKFPIVKTNNTELEGAHIVIWTTTPWTMPSNRAIAYGEDIEYGLFEIKSVAEESRAIVGDKVLLALSLTDLVKQSAKIEEWEQLKTFKGTDFEGTICHHPFHGQGYDFDVPVLEADFVTDEDGTGFVHVAPGHGADDFYLGQKHGVEVTDNVTDDGKFRDHVPLFAGMEVYTDKGELGGGNFAVLKEMNEVGALMAKGSLRHEYPHSWRSKTPVIFRTTPQWFIAMNDDNKLRETALKAIDETKWIPEKGQTRIRAMVENRPDWCISRQRAWGVPIALFVHKESGEILKDEDVLERIAHIFEEEGSDAWWSWPAAEFLGDNYNADDYRQIFDIVDVWFESGSTHAFVVEDDKTWPVFKGVEKIDLYLEGSDQHRGWFQSSLLESCGTRGRAPFKTVVTHGFVLDEKGYKMSKSQGNVVDPLKIMNQQGADILRLWSMLSDYSEDIRISQDAIKSASDIYRRIRNTFRFLLGALEGFNEKEMLSPEEYKDMPELELLMLHEIAEMDNFVHDHVKNYEFGKLAHKLHNWCNQTLSAFYFDIRKDSLYCDKPDDIKRRACRTVLYHLLDALSIWIAPILCFTAEEVWGYRPSVCGDEESVHLRTFPEVPEEWRNDALAEKWTGIKAARKDVLAAIEPLRASKELGSSLEALPVLSTNSEHVKSVSDEMADICITSQIKISDGEAPVTIERSEGDKCSRCWKILPEVGEKEEGLCNRCADAVENYRESQKAA